MIRFIFDMARRFRRDEKGIALTEYLILLGLLTSAVIIGVLVFGQRLGTLWQDWAFWLSDEDNIEAPAAISGTPTVPSDPDTN